MTISTNEQQGVTIDSRPRTIQEVAAWFRVGETAIREWMALEHDPLPHVRYGYRTLRFDLLAVQAWWKRRNSPPSPSVLPPDGPLQGVEVPPASTPTGEVAP